MKEDNKVHQPLIEDKKSISFIWILPVVIFAILAWIGYESYNKKGTNISVRFKTAEGLKEGVTPLEYKGLELGKVTKIDIHDLNSVKVNILVNKDVSKYVALSSSDFWIKKPTVSLTKISGLSTIISGNKIELVTKLKSDVIEKGNLPKFDFKGLEEKPDFESLPNAYYISLIASDVNSVEVETPLFYNSFQIGEIVSKEFDKEKVVLKAYIYDKYKYLVNESSNFILNKALKATLGPGGLNLEVSSLYSALVGGITVITEDKNAKKISENSSRLVYDSKEDLAEKVDIELLLNTAKDIDKNTLIMYKGLVVGKIKELILIDEKVNAKAVIYDKFKYLLTNNSTFTLQKTEVGLSGVKNIGNVISGNFIEIEYKKGKEQFSFDLTNTDLSNDTSTDNFLVTLFTNNLNSITTDTKIYYKNIVIGKVSDYSLTKNFKQIKLELKINGDFRKLINDKTLFYDMSSKIIELKNLDININYAGIKPLLEGAISILNLNENSKLTKKSFKLYNSFEDVKRIKRIQTEGFLIKASFDNGFKLKKNDPITFKGQEIGFVQSVKFGENNSKVKLFIYSKFKKYINSKSRFYKKSAVKFEGGLDGVVFELDSLNSLLNGSVGLDTSGTKSYKKYQIYSSLDSMKNASNSMEIIFDNVEGVKKDFSKVVYKGIEIGKVAEISLTSKHQAKVKIQIDKEYDSFSKKGTIFYLKKAKISLNEVSNIGSALRPVSLGVIKSNSKAFANSFIGYDSIDDVEKSSKGIVLKVKSLHPTSVSKDAPIYYKNVQIGKVKNIDLSYDGSQVLIDCLIFNKYAHLVRTNSQFYDISGFEFKWSLFEGAKFETNTVTSILKGGLLIVTPYEYDDIATTKTKFILKENPEENWKEMSPSIKIRD